MEIRTEADFNRFLANGNVAWPGGYPMYFVMADGEPLSFTAARQERDQIRTALQDAQDGYSDAQWTPIAVEINWEDPHLICAHTNKRIRSAYAEPE